MNELWSVQFTALCALSYLPSLSCIPILIELTSNREPMYDPGTPYDDVELEFTEVYIKIFSAYKDESIPLLKEKSGTSKHYRRILERVLGKPAEVYRDIYYG